MRIVLVICLLLTTPLGAWAAEETKDSSWGRMINSAQVVKWLDSAADTNCRVFSSYALANPEERMSLDVPFGPFTYELAEADVVLVGEQHDDPATHRKELDLVYNVFRFHRTEPWNFFIAMEMFERDTQDSLDRYANKSKFYLPIREGKVERSFTEDYSEATFLTDARAWANYQDYRSIVEFVRDGWGESSGVLIGSNLPTPLARRVAKEGLDAVLASLTPEERAWVAETTTSPKDEYWQRFLEAMGGGASDPAHGMGMSEAQIYGYYQAQCLKDDTMAETIARLRNEDPQRQVVHLSGSFHIDYHLGIVPRLKQRRPSDKIVTVALRPVENFEEATLQAALEAEPGVADYVVFVIREEPIKP